MQTVTLYAENFRTVHNTLCELRSLQERVTGVVSNDIADRLHRVIQGFEQGLADAYRQDNEAFDRKHDQYRYWQEHYGLKSMWSLYEVENMTLCHPYTDAEYVVYGDHWGEGGEVVRKIEGRDWNALYRAADAAIQASGDGHHIFIEAFRPIEGKPGYLRLSTGS